MEKILSISVAYLICALLTCVMLKNILGIGAEEGIRIKHEISTGRWGSIDLRHSGNIR